MKSFYARNAISLVVRNIRSKSLSRRHNEHTKTKIAHTHLHWRKK